MIKRTTVIGLLCFVVWLMLAPHISAPAQGESRVRARIGIQVQSGDRVFLAKARDSLIAGDLIRIYVHPEASSFLYVVYTENKKVTLLSMAQQKVHSSTLVLPSVQEAYALDGNSPVESFTVICSPEEIGELNALSSDGMPYEKWVLLEKDLMERSKIEMPSQPERPFPIVGNVRSDSQEPFVKKIPIFSGKDFLVKKFEFRVKK